MHVPTMQNFTLFCYDLTTKYEHKFKTTILKLQIISAGNTDILQNPQNQEV